MAELPSLSDLRAETDRNRIDFLQTDVAMCFTFADLAKTERELGSLDVAQQVLKKAETGYATIERLLSDVENADKRNEIGQQLTRLRSKLDAERQCLQDAGSPSASH